MALKLKYNKLLDTLDFEDVIKKFGNIEDDLNELIQSFVESHNSSLLEKSGTTYIISDFNNNIVGFFVLNLGTINKNSKNKLFFKRNNLNHDRYSIINLEFLLRIPGCEYEGIGEYIFNAIGEIIQYLEEKIMIKYIYVNSIRKRINYFEKKGFTVINTKSRNLGNNNVDMLFEI